MIEHAVHSHEEEDGFGQKTLGMYVVGMVGCIALTLLAFWATLSPILEKWQAFAIIYTAACAQFLVQIVCFLRLTFRTPQGRLNIMSFIFIGVILMCIVVGSLWIMWNLQRYGGHM